MHGLIEDLHEIHGGFALTWKIKQYQIGEKNMIEFARFESKRIHRIV